MHRGGYKNGFGLLRGIATLRAAIAGAAFVGLLGASAAQAADYCFDLDGDPLVVKGFKPPKPNKCKVFKGATLGGLSIVIGTACTNTAGDTLRVTWATQDYSAALVGRIDIPYPSLTGGFHNLTISYDTDTVIAVTGPASGAPCSATMPIE